MWCSRVIVSLVLAQSLIHAAGADAALRDAVDRECSQDAGESINLLQVQAARANFEDRQALTGERRLATELVHAVYTYGAPATSQAPFRNAATANGCFAGLRSYTEDLRGHENSIHQVDGGAVFAHGYLHAYISTLVLHAYQDSLYAPCGEDGQSGHFDWPSRAAQVYDHWPLHHEAAYQSRYKRVVVDGENVSKQEPIAAGAFFLPFAFRAYDNLPKQRQAAAKWKGWKIVGRAEDVHGDDHDPLTLVQEAETLNCALVFTGTNSLSEFSTSAKQYTTGYCGFEGVHVGYRNELWTLSKNLFYSMKPKLERCNKVICVGHSMGGSLCEIFAACANSGNVTDPDFQDLVWEQKTPKELLEVFTVDPPHSK